MGKIRKSCAFLCFAMFSLGLGLTGCNKDNSKPVEVTYTVTFNSNGGSAVAAQTVKHGEKATKPADPIKENFEFVAWYEDSATVTAFDFNTAITADWTLYAGWREAGGGDPDDPVDPVDPVDEGLLYFKDASWWNAAAGATWVAFDGSEPSAMTHIKYVEAEHFNYWSVELPENAESVKFYRYGTNTETQETSYWGAETDSLTLADRGDHNMYDISASAEAWKDNSAFAQGVWATYTPESNPDPVDPPEPGEGYALTVAIASDFQTAYNDANAKTYVYACNDTANEWLDAASGSVTIASQYTKFIVVRYDPAKNPSNDGWDGKWNQTEDIVIDSNKSTVTITGWGSGSLAYTYE